MKHGSRQHVGGARRTRGVLHGRRGMRVLGVKLATLYSYVNRGLLTSYRQNIRRQRLYRRAEVDALLAITPVERERAEIPLAETWTSEH